MSYYRDPKSAPRDGTIIVGLFENPFGRRRISAFAAFDVEGAADLADVATAAMPHWIEDLRLKQQRDLLNDPLSNFQALGDKPCGRMIGWRPLTPPENKGSGEI